VFLDEIGEIDLGVQPHLLRALESTELSRIGSRQTTPVNFRIVAASNRDLRQMAEEGRFRTDLYFRLSYVTVRIPPLRERLEDLPLLAAHFAAEYASRNGVPVPRLADAALPRAARPVSLLIPERRERSSTT
jgi:DNA-binding NtrC family response regulator